jgi:hypothetical protein
MKYTVKRPHLADRLYMAGEERDADPKLVGHLVANGVLIEKAAPAPRNKAKSPVKNKAK